MSLRLMWECYGRERRGILLVHLVHGVRSLAVQTFVAALALGCAKSESRSDNAPEWSRVEAALSTSPKSRDFVLRASNSIRLQSGANVAGADVGAGGRGSGPFLGGNVAVDIGAGAKVEATRNVMGESVRLGSGASVGDVQTNRLIQSNSRYGRVVPAVPLPLAPPVAVAIPGLTPLVVSAGAVRSASPGRFAVVSVASGGKLRLAAGTYEMTDLLVSSGARVEALGPVRLQINNRMSAGTGSFVGLASGLKLSAKDLRIEVSGRNGSTGDLNATPKAAAFESGLIVTALVTVPNGSLVFATGVQPVGAFFAKDIDISSGVKVTFQDGLDGPSCTASTCNDGNSCTVDACGATGCTHTAAAAGTSCGDGNACNGVELCDGAGRCGAGTPVNCTASDQCHEGGSCNPATGACSNPSKPDGASCDDTNACTQTDSCHSGACIGAEPVVCVAPDPFHYDGTCDIQTGECTHPPKPPAEQVAALEVLGEIPILDRSSSLTGTDVDNDGIRDDVDVHIESLSLTELGQKAAEQLARVLQRVVQLNTADPTALRQASTELSKAVQCLSIQFPDFDERSAVITSVEKVTFNTKGRTLQYIQFNNSQSGSVTKLLTGDTCEN